jgi:hypothetical protein
MIRFLLTSTLLLILPFGQAQIFINEASNSNGTTVVQADGSSPDWLELYNGSSSTMNLLGYGLTDDTLFPSKWQFPSSTLAANGYLTVLASGKSNISIIDHWETALNAGDTWDYYVPASNLAVDWNTVSYLPVGWLQGNLGIGYGDGDDATTITGPANSVYVRKTFNIANKDAIVAAVFDADFDDGFVAYLNGVEVARFGLAGYPPNWDEFSVDHEAEIYQGGGVQSYEIDTTLLNSILVNGTNVLAIEVHNASAASSDLSLIPFLTFGFNESTVYYSGAVHPYFNPVTSNSFFNTNFSIATAGESIYLSNPSGIIIDSLVIPDLEPDMSFGKFLDGTSTNSIFSIPTPGVTNNSSIAFSSYENSPVIETVGGFFTAGVSVTILNNSITGGVIRYTIDGQDPISSSTLYTGPFVLSTNSVVKAICFSASTSLLPSQIAAETYFFMEDFTLPVISISTDASNLVGPTGIFDNYTTDWRKPCIIEYFDADGQKQFESRASIKPDGGAGGSRSNPQHSVTIEPANTLYGEGEPVNYPLIPEKAFIDKFYAFYLRNGSNYWNQYPQKDATFMRMMRETNANSQAYSPVVAFVNGQYFGIYELREKANERYFEENYGNDPDSLDLLSISYFYGPSILRTVKGSDSSFYTMRDFVTTYDPASADYFDQCDKKIDLYNFADYLSAENWFGNYDWIYNNMKIARMRTKGNKWKFFLQDMELGLGGWADVNANLFDYFRNNNQPNPFWEIYNGLAQNTEFKNYFVNRYADLMNTVFRANQYTPIVDSMYNQLLPELPRHFQTWTGDIPGGMATYAAIHNQLLNDFSLRSDVVRDQIVNEFSLVKKVNVTLNVQPEGAGYIKISTIIPNELPWTGVYFDGVPVTMTAVANPGYTFSNWQVNSLIPAAELQNERIELNVSTSEFFKAMFVGTEEPLAVTISEIHYNPETSVDGGNWIELHNFGSTPLGLTNWSVKSKNFYDKFIFEDQTSIPANGYLVICQDTNLFKAQYPSVLNFVGATGFPWSNSYDSILLYNQNNEVVLNAIYRDKAPFPECADGWGRTLENSYMNEVQLDAEDWFCGCIGGSPGKAYEPCIEPITFTEINYNNSIPEFYAGDWIEIRNNTTVPINLSTYTFKDSKNDHVFSLPAVVVPAGGYWVLSNDLLNFGIRHSAVENVSGAFNFGLAGTDALRLFDDQGVLLTSVLYSNQAPWPSQPTFEDYTLEYSINPIYANPNVSTSWFVGCEGGSPGRAFTPCPVLPDGEMGFLYPNPTSGSINVVFNNQNNPSNTTNLYIYNMGGQIVHTVSVNAIESVVMQTIDASQFANGMYYIRIEQDSRMIQLPFVKL